MAGPLTLTDKNLDGVLEGEGIILIDFWARSYQPSVAFGALFSAAAEKHRDLVFGRIDVEKESQVADEFEIDFVPTLIVIRDGVMVVRDEESLDGEELEDLIEGVRGLDMDFVRADIAALEKKAAARATKKPAAKKPAAKAKGKPAAKKKPVAKATKKPARR